MPDMANMPAGVPGGGIPAGAAPGGAPKPGANPLAQAPANAGPVTIPQGNQGNVAAASAAIKAAADIIQKNLSLIPFGSEMHRELLTFLNKIGKIMEEGKSANDDGLKLQQLLQAAKQNAQQGPMAAMMRQFPAQAANQGPAMPQPAPAPGEAA